MCGIAGILSVDGKPSPADDVRRMCASITHRGPDDDGFYFDGDIALGMRRLSIIDLDKGHQPIGNEDGTVWVVMNGEIYNFRELRQELIARGHKLTTRTDTEVLVHLYEDLGADFVTKLRGMFAFAVWDIRRKQLVLGRDRLGIKPLYYGVAGGRLVFASELKAILQLRDVERQLDWRAVNHLFSTLTTPASQSIVRGIHKLEPAHVLMVRPNQLPRVSRYWDVVFDPNRRAKEADLVAELGDRVQECVRAHMVSDVPVGAFLSGGIDSSSVVAQMASQSGRRIKTFSVGFHEASFNELPYARTVSRHFSTEHHERIVTPDIAGILDDLVWHLDEPFGDASAIPTFFVSRLAAEHVKVVLSGDGGDEIFAGYDKYRVEKSERRYSRLPRFARRLLRRAGSALPEGAKGRNFLLHHSLTGWDRYRDACRFFRSQQLRELLHPDVFTESADGDDPRTGHWLSAAQYHDLHNYLPLDILAKVDRMSMAHSLEVRVPLLDHTLVEFAATIPPQLNLNSGGGKMLLKKSMRGILPDEIIDRPKRGFAVPLSSWFRGSMESFAREVLLSKSARERNVVNVETVAHLLDLHRAGRSLDLQLWTLIAFELWCRTFLDAAPRKAVAREEAFA